MNGPRPMKLVAGAGSYSIIDGMRAAAFPHRSPRLIKGQRPVLPRARGVWRLCSQGGPLCVEIEEMVRSAGLAPASPDWHSGILLLNDDRK